MAVKKVSGNAAKTYYKLYEDVYAKHKKAKLARHCKKFPLDEQSAKRLKDFEKDGVPYARRTPKTKGGWLHARFNKEQPNTFESIIATLTRADARLFAQTNKAAGGKNYVAPIGGKSSKKGQKHAK